MLLITNGNNGLKLISTLHGLYNVGPLNLGQVLRKHSELGNCIFNDKQS